MRFVSYQPYNITRIVGTIRSSVQVEFAPDEEIAHVALGNTVAWEVAPAGHILFLKPRENQPATNISVVTTRRDGSKRSYQMELVVRDGSVDAGQNTYFYYEYRYPADEAERRRLEDEAKKRAAEAGYADQVLGIHDEYGPPNNCCSAQQGAAINPQAAYDNGEEATFASCGGKEMPAAYIENSDGTESPGAEEDGSGRSRSRPRYQPKVHPAAWIGHALHLQRGLFAGRRRPGNQYHLALGRTSGEGSGRRTIREPP